MVSTAQLLEQFKQLSDVERLEFIEAATRLVRENLTAARLVPRQTGTSG